MSHLRTARRLAVPVLAAAAVATAAAPPASAAVPRSYALPGDDVFPEGIATSGSTFYVSSTTDGTIYRGMLDRPRTSVFLPGGRDGRTSAVGLKATRDRLLVAGGSTGLFFVYDTSTGDLVRRYTVNATESNPTFLNDETVAPNGDVYITDSVRPVLYRIPAAELRSPVAGTRRLQVFRDFTGTDLRYREGFNVNGIAATDDGRYLLVVQSNTGKLFRVGIADGSVRQVDIAPAFLGNGDGLLLEGRRLYAVRNAEEVIVELGLSADFTEGVKFSRTTRKDFAFPTTVAAAGNRLLVVNSQFDQRGGDPAPFTVSSIQKP